MDRRDFLTTVIVLALSAPSIIGAEAYVIDWKNGSLGDLDRAVTQLAAKHDVPGVAMAVVGSDGSTSFVMTGVQDRGDEVPVSETTIFQVASVSKVLTGIVVNDLVAQGLIDPEAAVIGYLPEALAPAAAKKLDGVTVAHLLHHRSGLPRDTVVHPRQGNDPMRVPLTEQDLLEDLRLAEMVGAPEERYEYSNLGYAVLGYVAERASGEPYHRLLTRVVTGPLGLDDTSTQVPTDEATRLATPYRKEDGQVATDPWRTGKLVAASGIYSTADDLAVLLRAQLAAYMSPQTNDTLLILTEDTAPVDDGRVYGYGLNVQTVPIGEGFVDLYYHSGDMDGFAAFYGFAPSTGRGVVLLTSRGGEGRERLQSVAIRYVLDLPVSEQ